MEPRRRWLLFLVAMAALAGCSRGRHREVALWVAADADLQPALDDLGRSFHRQHAGIVIETSFAPSGDWTERLAAGAPFDLFLSADTVGPRRLLEQGVGLEGSEFIYAHGELVVWVPDASPLDLEGQGIRALLEASVRHVAIADPRRSPHGRAARAALRSLGLEGALASRLLEAASVAEAARAVDAGQAEAGLIPRSLAQAAPLADRGRSWRIPADAHPVLEQGGLILRRSRVLGIARDFRAFMLGAEGREILGRHGYRLP